MYWRYQGLIDVVCGVLCVELMWRLPEYGGVQLIRVTDLDAISLAKTWVGPIVTLIGMMSATTAFLFSVIDRPEFSILKGSKSQRYLWQVFSQNLFWLLCGAVAACITSLLKSPLSIWWMHVISFLLVMIFICLSKFVWVMRQIISVRVSQVS